MNESKSENNRFFLKIITNLFLLLIGSTIFIFIFHLANESIIDLFTKVLHIDCIYIFFILVATIVIFWAISRRWCVIIDLYSDSSVFPRGYIFYNTCISLFMMSIFSFAGYIGTKSLSYKLDHNISVLRTSFASIVEMMVGLIILLILLIPACLYIFEIISFISAFTVNIAIVIGLAVKFPSYYKLMLRMILIPFFQIMKFIKDARFVRINIDLEAFNPAPYYRIDDEVAFSLFFYTLVGYYLVLIKCFFVFNALQIDINFLEFALVYPFGYFIASIGISPGNIGISDAGWFGVLVMIGVSNEQAALFVLGYRIFNELSYLLIAIGSYVIYTFLRRRSNPILETRLDKMHF